MITWKDKLAFVGMPWKIRVVMGRVGFKWEVKVWHDSHSGKGNGLLTYGSGDTLEEALESGARGQGMDWHSIAHKMTEAAWAKMSRC